MSTKDPAVYWYRSGSNPNLGDEVTRFLLERRYGLPFRHVNDVDDADFVGVGSNLNQVFGRQQSRKRTRPLAVVGAGFMHPYLRVPVLPAVKIHSVRGYLSRALLPEPQQDVTLGDPGLLLSEIVTDRPSKKYDLGFIPHISRITDGELINSVTGGRANATVIDFRTDDIDATATRIAECRAIVSQSLHGLIFADSLQIPNAWLYDKALHAGGEFKFYDYFSTVDRDFAAHVDPAGGVADAEIERALFSIDASVLQRMKDSVDDAFLRAIESESGPWLPYSDCASKELIEDGRVYLESYPHRRAPRRPPEMRQEGFEEQFDYDSLFFSVYEESGRIRLDGPRFGMYAMPSAWRNGEQRANIFPSNGFDCGIVVMRRTR